jgi:UDP-N-acetylmuramoylalanine--D-glutamate ligase
VDVAGRRALVVGLGKSGVAACRLLATHGARVAATDGKGAVELADALAQLKGVPLEQLYAGGITDAAFAGRDLVVVSPGVPLTLPPLLQARLSGVELIGEAELAARFIHEPVLGITGTNGKSTTTALTGHLLEAAGRSVFVGGNLGNALSNRVLGGGKHDACVVELSSFQLEAISRLRCAAACVLNVTPDHLDRYDSLDVYADAKARIFQNQHPGDAAVLNLRDARVRAMHTGAGVLRRGFDPRFAQGQGSAGARLESEVASISTWNPSSVEEQPAQFQGIAQPQPQPWASVPADAALTDLDGALPAGQLTAPRRLRIDAWGFDLRAKTLRGAHNAENALAALLLALHLGARPEDLQRGLDSYPGLPHRLEPVLVLDGAEWVNDSKATNVDSVEKSLSAFEHGVILIAGGRGKGAPYAALRALFPGRVKALLTLGEDGPRIARELGDLAPVTECGDLASAVARAQAMAKEGDTVLLSPACASYDQFRNFEDRGDQFKALVRGLT